MATLTKQVVTLSGIGPTYAAATGGGDEFVPSDKSLLHVKNGSGSPITVTIVTPRTDPRSGQAISDVAVSVPATGERMIGPFPRQAFAGTTAADPEADITYSGVTSLTIAHIELS